MVPNETAVMCMITDEPEVGVRFESIYGWCCCCVGVSANAISAFSDESSGKLVQERCIERLGA